MSDFELAKQYFLEGLYCLGAEDFSKAEHKFLLSLQLMPNRISTLINLSVAQLKLKKYSIAKISAEKAIFLGGSNPDAYLNLGLIEKELRNFEGAIYYFDIAINSDPEYAEALSNKASILLDLKRIDEARALFEKAISLKPDYAEAFFNKGNLFYKLQRFDEARALFEKAISLKPDYAEAWSNIGVIYDEAKNYAQATTHYAKALSFKPNIDWVYGDLLHTKMKMCSWNKYQEAVRIIDIGTRSYEKTSAPFVIMSLVDDPRLHHQSAEIYIQDRYPFDPALGPIPKRSIDEKIRIGYFSADFKVHPIAFLVAEFLEMHDTTRFEIYAFSLKRASDDKLQKRFIEIFDVFVDVEDKTDIEIAGLVREFAIDIAIDLSGFTLDSRTGIFAYRAAPIQVNYLGYPGTMGCEYIDYIIADKILIPKESQLHYSEKVAYLPHSYQPNGRKQILSDKEFTRKNLGLPEHSFVFCCFNNNYKILPAIFDGWMRILNSVDSSVLWLLEDNALVADNLKNEAKKRGVNSERLVFAKRMPHSEHLARHHFADLFLDTFPYNAHTTASDALWAGIPVLTLLGESFASRVAASLLTAVNLSELITNTQQAYEMLAIELATNPTRLYNIKEVLKKNRLITPLFDTPLFTKNIESLYIKMLERYHADMQPDSISIS